MGGVVEYLTSRQFPSGLAKYTFEQPEQKLYPLLITLTQLSTGNKTSQDLDFKDKMQRGGGGHHFQIQLKTSTFS